MPRADIRQAALDEGKCGTCLSRPRHVEDDGRVRKGCEECIEQARERARTLAGIARREGKCVACHEGLPELGYETCRRCLDYAAARYKRIRADGLCGTCQHEPATAGMASCAGCREAWRKHAVP